MKKIAVIQMGAPPDAIVNTQGEPALWFAKALNIPINDVLVRNPAAGDTLPNAHEFDVAIITGSWSMVTDKLDWSEWTAQWAKQLIMADKPLLGVCYGHQIMAHAMGGVVDYNPKGQEQGTFEIQLNQAGIDDEFIGSLPKQFAVHLSHSQSVITAPQSAKALAFNSHDNNQILRYSKNVLSFQFHPEFTVAILQAYMARRKANTQGVFSKAEDLVDTPIARELMQKFVFDT